MRVTVLGTGGTIASTAGEGGATPTKSGADLVRAVPELDEYGDVEAEQVAQTPSYEMTAETLETVGDRVRELDADPAVDAVVVTHGTDTMEETGYFLDVAVQPETPVLLTGAQRRPDQVGPDGPRNLLTAVRMADEFATRDGGGTYVAFDEAAHAARYATKAHTSKVAAFRSVGAGPVATVDPNGVRLLRRPRSESTAVPDGTLEPSVDVFPSGVGVDGRRLQRAVEDVDGVVVEGTGLGNVTAGLGEAVRTAVRDDVPVVVASRCPAGRTAPVYGGTGGGEKLREYGAVFAGDLPAQKARIKLALALSTADDRAAAVRAAFA
jgi:L-asparaginase